MKIAVVPAQITTIEDKVAGGLNLTQLILLVAPVFLSGVVYSVLSPVFSLSLYKILIIAFLFIAFGSLAIKIKGVLLLNWLLILTRYMARPGLYVYDKNSSFARGNDTSVSQAYSTTETTPVATRQILSTPPLSPGEQFTIESLINHPTANFHFKTDKKGNLHVAISKAE